MADEHHHDPTFYRSPRDAAAGPPEKLAYVAAFSPGGGQPDAIAVVDTDPASASYASVVGFTELPHTGAPSSAQRRDPGFVFDVAAGKLNEVMTHIYCGQRHCVNPGPAVRADGSLRPRAEQDVVFGVR